MVGVKKWKEITLFNHIWWPDLLRHEPYILSEVAQRIMWQVYQERWHSALPFFRCLWKTQGGIDAPPPRGVWVKHETNYFRRAMFTLTRRITNQTGTVTRTMTFLQLSQRMIINPPSRGHCKTGGQRFAWAAEMNLSDIFGDDWVCFAPAVTTGAKHKTTVVPLFSCSQ